MPACRPTTMMLLHFALVLALQLNFGMVRAEAAGQAEQLLGGLPLELAIKQVRGNGLRVLATFEDPYCPYCKQLALETAGISDVTIYTFIYPVLSPSSRKMADAIWCAPDRGKAWRSWMSSGRHPKPRVCDTRPIDQLVALGKSMKIGGVPTLFLANGERYSGEKSQLALEMAISSPRIMEFQAGLESRRSRR